MAIVGFILVVIALLWFVFPLIDDKYILPILLAIFLLLVLNFF